MCVQCMINASTAVGAVGGAAGIRVWLKAKIADRIPGAAMRGLTAALVVGAVVASSVTISGSG